MFSKNMQLPCLLDIYGPLLSDRRRELLEYYYNDDYSLSEISELTGISRQGIRDSLKKSESELNELESKLRLNERRLVVQRETSAARSIAEQLMQDAPDALAAKLTELLGSLSAIDDTVSADAEEA